MRGEEKVTKYRKAQRTKGIVKHKISFGTFNFVWCWDCSCGESKKDYRSMEYAIAAGRRHERRMGK